MKCFLIFITVISLVFSVIGEPIRFDNYKLYRFTPENEQELRTLRQLQEKNFGVIFWREPSKVGRHVTILFPPHLQGDTLDFLTENIRSSKLVTTNIQTVIEKEAQSLHRSQNEVKALNWDSYGTLEDIYAYLDDQSSQHANIAELLDIGRTTENRPLRVIKISKSNGSNRPAIWVDGGIHAREWIGHAVATYIINDLLNGNDTEVAKILDDFDVFVCPVLNPDGYAYTHLTNRMWRKTRTLTNSTLGCRGIDANRNWDYFFNTGGSSGDPCVDGYHGDVPFSALETRAVAEFYNGIANRTKMFLSLHSIGQQFLLPYGYSNVRHENFDEWMRIGQAAAAALEKPFGTQFTPININDQFGVSSGGSVDWIYGVHNTSIVYAIELRDKGEYEFLLPPEQIRPSGIEIMEAFKELVRQLRNRI